LTARGISGAEKKDFFFIHNKLPLISLCICIKPFLYFFNDYSYYNITRNINSSEKKVTGTSFLCSVREKKETGPFYYILPRAETVLSISEKEVWEMGPVAWKRDLATFLCYHFLPPFFYGNFGNLDNL